MRSPRTVILTALAVLLATQPPAAAPLARYNRKTPAAGWRTLTELILPTWLPSAYWQWTPAQGAARRGWLRALTGAVATLIVTVINGAHHRQHLAALFGFCLGAAFVHLQQAKRADQDAAHIHDAHR